MNYVDIALFAEVQGHSGSSSAALNWINAFSFETLFVFLSFRGNCINACFCNLDNHTEQFALTISISYHGHDAHYAWIGSSQLSSGIKTPLHGPLLKNGKECRIFSLISWRHHVFTMVQFFSRLRCDFHKDWSQGQMLEDQWRQLYSNRINMSPKSSQ